MSVDSGLLGGFLPSHSTSVPLQKKKSINSYLEWLLRLHEITKMCLKTSVSLMILLLWSLCLPKFKVCIVSCFARQRKLL